LKLLTVDQQAQSEARTTYNTDTNWQTKVTKTFTPATQGDYIILISATMDGSSASYDWKARLNIDDATYYTTSNIETAAIPNRYFWGLAVKVNLTAAEHNIRIDYATENTGGTVGIAHANIVILRADEFYNVYSQADETRSTTILAAYQNI